ncbi:MAG TPA: SRPBCC family protein [Terriglobales bacterium]|nr:SRPBCC family protein [Terriglobales bacterium]
MNFQSKRVHYEYTQTNSAPPEKVFPLLCPVREAEWVPGWQYRLIYSQSGVAEDGCVFTTVNDDGSETTWIVTEYDPRAFTIAFAWVNPGLVAAQIRIRLEAKSTQETTAHIRYTYTGLSQQGNLEVDRYDGAWFRHKMQSWETAINHYLRTGSKIRAAGWE